jgi:ABC-2 type transport system permease protein
MFASTLIYLVILYVLGGTPEVPMLIGGYLAFLLLGRLHIHRSICLIFNGKSNRRCIISFVILLLVNLMDAITSFASGIFAKILDAFSLLSRYSDMNSGILDFTSIIYYLSFTAVFLFLTTGLSIRDVGVRGDEYEKRNF